MSGIDMTPPAWWLDWLRSEGVDPATICEGATFASPGGILTYTDLEGVEYQHTCKRTPHGDVITRVQK